MTITRQHAETDVHELVGVTCERLLGVSGASADTFVAIYLLANGVWYRLFLDAGLLFLDECAGPDPEDDLDAGAEYLNLGEKLGCEGDQIQQMSMRDSTLALRFASGISLLLRDLPQGSELETVGIKG